MVDNDLIRRSDVLKAITTAEPYEGFQLYPPKHDTILNRIKSIPAADAIEELLTAADSVVKCKDCKWWSKQEASIQGRCARLAIYPTGEFYCASGSKAEPPKGVE